MQCLKGGLCSFQVFGPIRTVYLDQRLAQLVIDGRHHSLGTSDPGQVLLRGGNKRAPFVSRIDGGDKHAGFA